jgi:hypothetical protein
MCVYRTADTNVSVYSRIALRDSSVNRRDIMSEISDSSDFEAESSCRY